MTLAIAHAQPLAPRTTLKLGGPARLYVEGTVRKQVCEALRWAKQAGQRAVILGGGSNLIVGDEGFDGLVVHVATRGIDLTSRGEHVLLTVEAGEPWQNVVDTALAEDLAGLECLTGIPGSTGATPIQNVGAYGQEVADVIDAVEVFDRTTHEQRWLDPSECGFGYRTSAFKSAPDRLTVLAVRFRLVRHGAPTVRYPELRGALDVRHAQPSLRQVADAVYALRRSKSMVIVEGDENACSAGSFFTNPTVPRAEADAIRTSCVSAGIVRSEADVPCYPALGEHLKLSAAWLIEHAGFHKGERRGSVGISSRHALSLVHHGGGSTRELLAFADEIQNAVAQRFGVALEIEPTRW